MIKMNLQNALVTMIMTSSIYLHSSTKSPPPLLLLFIHLRLDLRDRKAARDWTSSAPCLVDRSKKMNFSLPRPRKMRKCTRLLDPAAEMGASKLEWEEGEGEGEKRVLRPRFQQRAST